MQHHLTHLKGHVPLHTMGMTLVLVIFNILFPSPFLGSKLALILGIILLALGTILFVWSEIVQRKLHHDHRADQQVTSFMRGPYRFSRQPLYVGLFVMMVGLGVLLNALVMVVLSALVAVFVFIIIVPEEEELLRRVYPYTYPLYQKKVRMII